MTEKLQCFDTIQKKGTPATIYSLFGFLKSDNILIREKAAETILHLFHKLTSQNEYDCALKHLRINKTDLNSYRVDFGEKIYLQLLEIASLNSNVYLREKAVKELGKLKNAEGLKYLLLRLGDWVLPVRQAAVEAVYSYLDASYFDEFLNQFLTIDGLLNIKRVDLTEIHTRIMEFIFKQPFSDAFYRKIKMLDDKTRLHYYRNLFAYTIVSKEQAVRIGKDKNFLIRLEVLKQLSLFDTAFQKECITSFLQDPSARIRVTALYASASYQPCFDDKIKTGLSDPSFSVRELCRYLLKPAGPDFAEIYRERIVQEQFVPGSITGLSETGTEKDLPIFEQYIYSGSSKIITGCLAAIYKLDPDRARHYSLELLTHVIKSVRSKAAEWLAQNYDTDTLQIIRKIYLSGNYEIKTTVLGLYGKIGGWSIIGDLLFALTEENNDLQNTGWQLLYKWKLKATRLFTTPSKAEMERANYIYRSMNIDTVLLTENQKNLLQDLQFYLR